MTVLHDLLAGMLGQPPTAWVLLAVACAFVVGGTVKGLLGVGLPLITAPLLALVIPSPKAIALMVMPIVLTAMSMVVIALCRRRLWTLHQGFHRQLDATFVVSLQHFDAHDLTFC